MRSAGALVVAVGLLGALGSPGRAGAQVVGFAPTVGSLPDGVGLSVTPAVSADRRYVRLSINAGFQTIDGFQNFPVPGAVSGGGNAGGLGGGGGGGAGGGIGVISGMNGPIGPATPGGVGGMAYSMGPTGFDDVFVEDLGAWRPAPKRGKVTRPRTTRPRAPAPAAVAATQKKKKP